MAIWRSLVDPRVASHLIADEGEIVIDEVRRHAMAYIGPVLMMVLGAVLMIATLWSPLPLAWLPLLGGLVLFVIGGYRVLSAHMDRFVITNMRVFRVNGIVAQHTATMPMSRILDISVHKPFIGRIFGYGHFVFESAAQDQGLRDIRFVGRPDERDLTIQRVIQRSGLRSAVRPPGSAIAPTGAVASAPTAPTPASPATPTPEYDSAEIEYDPTDGGPSPVSVDGDENLVAEGSNSDWLAASWSERDRQDHERARKQ